MKAMSKRKCWRLKAKVMKNRISAGWRFKWWSNLATLDVCVRPENFIKSQVLACRVRPWMSISAKLGQTGSNRFAWLSRRSKSMQILKHEQLVNKQLLFGYASSSLVKYGQNEPICFRFKPASLPLPVWTPQSSNEKIRVYPGPSVVKAFPSGRLANDGHCNNGQMWFILGRNG